MSNYITFPCSCYICKKPYTSKGIHSHYLINHTDEGGARHKEKTIKGSKLGALATAKKKKLESQEKEILYNLTPKYCSYCAKLIPFNKRNNIFCSLSCSAKNLNNIRIITGYKLSDESNKRKIAALKAIIRQPSPPKTSIKFCSCEICNQKFIWNEIKRGSARFCSSECMHSHRSRKARNNPGLGTKRSKDEIALYDLCSSHFKNVTSNEKLVDGWDADILIYDTKTAILWNGPWHYKEMNFGNHSLKQVQNRDSIKIKLFENEGWKVLIFEDRYHTPQSAFSLLINDS